MSKIKQLLQDFKKFITRGNVVDMAVAVIIGGAFNAIVTSLTNNIIKPLINWVIALAVGGNSLGLITMLKPMYKEGETVPDMTTSIYIDWGTFIMKIIDFLIIALVLFIIIKVFMGLQNARNEFVSEGAKADRKRARAIMKEKCVSYTEAMAQVEKEKAEAAAIAAAEAEEAAKNAPAPAPTTEELLTQIRDLLAAQNKTAESDSTQSE
ncbi:MAG: large conductance mechanosensitive channel protein MscL [Candidatus Coproplasma sp.]